MVQVSWWRRGSGGRQPGLINRLGLGRESAPALTCNWPALALAPQPGVAHGLARYVRGLAGWASRERKRNESSRRDASLRRSREEDSCTCGQPGDGRRGFVSRCEGKRFVVRLEGIEPPTNGLG